MRSVCCARCVVFSPPSRSDVCAGFVCCDAFQVGVLALLPRLVGSPRSCSSCACLRSNWPLMTSRGCWCWSPRRWRPTRIACLRVVRTGFLVPHGCRSNSRALGRINAKLMPLDVAEHELSSCDPMCDRRMGSSLLWLFYSAFGEIGGLAYTRHCASRP